MLVSDLFAKLSYGELSNLSISGEGSGTIIVGKRPKIVGYLNECLLRLYSRFLLKESYLTIEQVDHRTMYPLRLAYAATNDASTELDKFIQDTDDNPFLDDVIKILVPYDLSGQEITLNDSDNMFSFFTPQPNVLQIPNPSPGDPVGITYQARHPIIPSNDLTVVIDIPFTLEGALSAYIASKVYGDMNTQEARARAQEHLQTYEHICAEVNQGDLVNASTSRSNTRFEKGGWA